MLFSPELHTQLSWRADNRSRVSCFEEIMTISRSTGSCEIRNSAQPGSSFYYSILYNYITYVCVICILYIARMVWDHHIATAPCTRLGKMHEWRSIQTDTRGKLDLRLIRINPYCVRSIPFSFSTSRLCFSWNSFAASSYNRAAQQMH